MGRRRAKSDGSVFYRSDRQQWVGIVDLGRDMNGKRKRKTVYGETKDAVVTEMQRLNGRTANGEFVPTSTPTVATFLNDWYATNVDEWSHSTQRSYRGNIDNHLIPAFGTMRLEHLDPPTIQRWITAHKTKHGARRRIELAHAVLRSALSSAKRLQQVGINSAENVALPTRKNKRKIKIFTPAQAQDFLTAAREHHLGALFTVGFACGLRVGEILGLTWDKVNLETGDITIDQQLQWIESDESRRANKGKRTDRRKPELVAVKTENALRTLQAPEACLQDLRDYRRRQREARLKGGPQWVEWVEAGLVFTTYRVTKKRNTKIGTPLHPRNVHRVLTEILKKAKLPLFGMHTLRHNSASLLIASNVKMEEIAKLLGHSETRVSSDLYGHLVKQTSIKAARIMDDFFSRGK